MTSKPLLRVSSEAEPFLLARKRGHCRSEQLLSHVFLEGAVLQFCHNPQTIFHCWRLFAEMQEILANLKNLMLELEIGSRLRAEKAAYRQRREFILDCGKFLLFGIDSSFSVI